MKKIFVFMVLLCLFVFSSSSTAKVEAYPWGETPPLDGFFVWFFNDYGDTRIVLDASFDSSKEVISFHIPPNEFYTLESTLAYYEYKISFYGLYGLIDSFSWTDLFTYDGETRLYGDFEIDVRSLGLNTSEILRFAIDIPLTIDWTPTWIDDFTAFVEGNSTLEQLDNDTDYFFTYTKGTGFYRFKLRAEIPYLSKNMLLDIPFTGLTTKYNSYRSVLYLYNNTGTLIDYLYLDESDYYMYEFFHVYSFDGYDEDDLSHFELLLYLDGEDYNIDNFTTKNQNLNVSFDPPNARLVHYIVSGSEIHSQFVLAPDGISFYDDITEPEGLELSHWVLRDGSTFDESDITVEEYPETDIYVYARFRLIGSDVTFVPDDSVYNPANPFDDIYTALGINSATGYILTFFGVLVLLTAIGVFLKLPLLGIVITDFLIFLLFNYWGMIPTYLVIVIYILFGIFGLLALTGLGKGGSYE